MLTSRTIRYKMSYEKSRLCLHVQLMEGDQTGSNYAVYLKFLEPKEKVIRFYFLKSSCKNM